MLFDIECPNGHTIRCNLEMAGKTGHCPKCSEKFEIPTIAEIRESFGDDLDEETAKELDDAEKKLKELARQRAAKRAQMEAAAKKASEAPAPSEKKEAVPDFLAGVAENTDSPKSGIKTEKKSEPEPQPEPQLEIQPESQMIQFLCPNGHELSVSADKAGKVGKCPECGAKFRVPELEDVSGESGLSLDLEENEAEKPAVPPIPAAPPVPVASPVPSVLPPAPPVPPLPSEEEVSSRLDFRTKISLPIGEGSTPGFLFPGLAMKDDGEVNLGLDDAKKSIPEALRMDPMAKVFWTLWNRDVKPVNVRIHTADGKCYPVFAFNEDKSLSPIGFFETREEDGTEIDLIVRWDNVVRILSDKPEVSEVSEEAKKEDAE